MVPDYLPLPKWQHLKKMNRILNTCTNRKITGKGDIFISSIISIRKWKKTSHRWSHSSLWVFHAGDPCSWAHGLTEETLPADFWNRTHHTYTHCLHEPCQSCFHLDLLRATSGNINKSQGGKWWFHQPEGSWSHGQAACIFTLMQHTFVSLLVHYYSGETALYIL